MTTTDKVMRWAAEQDCDGIVGKCKRCNCKIHQRDCQHCGQYNMIDDCENCPPCMARRELEAKIINAASNLLCDGGREL